MKLRHYLMVLCVALVCVFSVSTEALAAQVTGECGTSATYVYDTDTKTLTISGKGEVTESPWLGSYEGEIQKVVVGEGITALCEKAFYNCKAMSSMTLPSTIQTIGRYAFGYNEALKSITIPKSLTEADYAFESSGLTSVVFQSGMTTIPEGVVRGCASLTSVTIPSTVTVIEDYAFYSCTKLPAVTLPAKIKSIGHYAFGYDEALTSVTIPKTLEEADYAFSDAGLTKVVFQSGMTTIPEGVVRACKKLTSVTIPSTVTVIDDYAFYSCTSLANITLPAKLTSIGHYAFGYDESLKSVVIPKNVTDADYAFSDTGLTKVTFSKGMKTVPEGIVRGCKKLTTVVFDKNIKHIEDYVFYGCDSLSTIELPWYLESLGFYAFGYCENLKKVIGYQNLTDISEYAFASASKPVCYGKKNSAFHKYAKAEGYTFKTCKVPALKGTTYKSGGLKYTVVNDAIGGKGTIMVTGLAKSTSQIVIPGTVKLESYSYKVVKIKKKAFYNKSGLKKITIKSTTIKGMGKNAFKGINKNATVIVPKAKYDNYKKLLKKAGLPKTATIKKG